MLYSYFKKNIYCFDTLIIKTISSLAKNIWFLLQVYKHNIFIFSKVPI